MEKQIILSKIFSREKPLVYFSMWNDSDRMGYEDFLGHKIQHNLFIVPSEGDKGSVWYANDEFSSVMDSLKKRATSGSTFIQSVVSRLDDEWKHLGPYILDQKTIDTIDDFDDYYTHLITWWSAMTAVFELPNLEGVNAEDQKTVLSYRENYEKYTEKMSALLKNFWLEQYPEHSHLASFVMPQEVIAYGKGDEAIIGELEKRTNGCFLYNNTVYQLEELDRILSENNLKLEEIEIDDVNEIHGQVAQTGLVQGTVRVVRTFTDMKEFKAGDILVTEMTNPDYVPIMKIAAAIVTDEGGITCHAAITSRELGVPCVIGTKIATQVLKDGDEVEVDATNGKVKIVNRVE